MATINKLKTQIEDANALGLTNLAEKGVELSESATTYEIMQGIANISTVGESKPQLTAESSVAQVTLPVIVPTVTAEINSNIIADSSGSLEE